MKSEVIVLGNITKYFQDNKCIQIVWKSPQEKDDNGKVRSTTAWTYLRLWDNNGSTTLSQSIKTYLGSGDIPIVENIPQNINDLKDKSEVELTKILFRLKGDYSHVEQGLISSWRKNHNNSKNIFGLS